MTATVISLASHRSKSQPPECCPCSPADDITCYAHRLVDLVARVEDVRGDVESFRFCDMATFNRLTQDVLDVLTGITDECLPERGAR